jgi:hypothetical protein
MSTLILVILTGKCVLISKLLKILFSIEVDESIENIGNLLDMPTVYIVKFGLNSVNSLH